MNKQKEAILQTMTICGAYFGGIIPFVFIESIIAFILGILLLLGSMYLLITKFEVKKV